MSNSDNVTWSLKSLLIPAFIAGFIYFVSSGPGKPPSSSDSLTTDSLTEKKTKKKRMIPPKPKDGTVTLSQIFVHPIKSCRGTSVQSCTYSPQGLDHDRKFSILDVKTGSVITARQVSKIVLISPKIEGNDLIISFPADSGCKSFTVPLDPSPEILSTWKLLDSVAFFDRSVDGYIVQSSPSSSSPPSAPSDILSTYFGKPVNLIYKGPAPRAVDTTFEFPELKATSVYQDMYPLLVLSEEGMADVERETRARIGQQGIEEKWAKEKVQLRRFRPNLVFKGAGAWAEDNWEEIKIGSLDASKITLVSKCGRCLLPNVSPDTGERDKAVPFKVIMRFRTQKDPLKTMTPCVGSNAVVEKSGTVSVGDVVYVTKMLGEGEARVPFAEEEEKEGED